MLQRAHAVGEERQRADVRRHERDGSPDLVAVEATNGRIGYVYATELSGPGPSSPEEAATLTPPPARTIPVYESDGSTTIGEFTVGR